MNRMRIGENESLPRNQERIEQALDIMDRHADELASVDEDIVESQRRRDREIKDSHLHSVPKAKKHLRT